VFATFGGGAIAAIDSATFFGSAALLGLMTVPEPDRERATIPFVEELLAGWRHIRTTPVLRMVMFAISVALAVLGLLEVALFALVDEGLRRPPEFVGVIATIQGIGSIGGGLVAGPALRRVGETALLGISLAVIGAGLGMLVVPSMPLVIIGVTLVGVGLAAHLVAYMTLIQRRTANELQGRVFSAAEAILTIPFAASMALGVVLISVVGFRVIYAVNGVALLLVGAWMYLWRDPEIGRAERVPERAANQEG
jgi:MFS family permease